MSVKNILVLGTAVAVGALSIGCDKAADTTSAEAVATQASSEGHSHDGWWCGEHGLPEEVDTQCHPKLVAEFKAKGDWCQEHDRPASQCFVCYPEKKAELAALYEAKFGSLPPGW